MSSTIWQEINYLKRRVEALEREGEVLVEETFELVNSQYVESEIRKVSDTIRRLVQKYGRVIVDVITEN